MTEIDTEFYHGKNLLLLGGFGFIGENLIRRFSSLNAKIKVVTRNTGKRKTGERSVETIYADPVINFQKIEEHLGDSDVIVNLINGDKNDFTKQNELTDLNFKILNFCVSKKLDPVLVHMGSRLQYSPSCPSPIIESDKMEPTTIYGLEKMLSEDYYRFFSRKYGLKTLCLRVANLYGPTENLPLKKGLVHELVYSALNGNMQINEDVERHKDLIYIDDFADFLLLGIQNENCYGRALNVGSGEKMKVIEIASEIKDIFGYNGEIKISGKAEDDFSFYMGVQKAKNLTGWRPKIQLREGLIKMKEGLEELEVKK